MKPASVPISEALKNITVNVTVTGLAKAYLRMNIGIFLMKVAIKIIGTKGNIDIV